MGHIWDAELAKIEWNWWQVSPRNVPQCMICKMCKKVMRICPLLDKWVTVSPITCQRGPKGGLRDQSLFMAGGPEEKVGGGGYENFLMDREWARKKNWEGQSGRLNIPSQKIFAAPAAFLISLQNKYIQQTHSIIILIKMRMFRAT